MLLSIDNFASLFVENASKRVYDLDEMSRRRNARIFLYYDRMDLIELRIYIIV